MKYLSLSFFCLILIFAGCKEDPTANYSIEKLSGMVQKGPYINGTAITVAELDDNLNPTGKTFSTQILDNKGSFEVDQLDLVSPFVEIRADGYYFNEVAGEKSKSQLTLFGLADISEQTSVNVNIMTSLEKGRVKYLMDEGLSFSDAKTKAQSEILAVFSIELQDMPNSELLDISKNDEENAILLAVSVLLQGQREVADLTELLANINTDMREDGVLNSASNMDNIEIQAKYLDTVLIRKNLEDRYEVLGVDASIPRFEKYLDRYLLRDIPIEVDAVINSITCYYENSGAIDLTISGGYPPYSIGWSNGSSTEDIDLLFPGKYTVTITDSENFIRTIQFEVNREFGLEPFSIQTFITVPTSSEIADGSVEIIIEGGTPPYTYLWSNGATDKDLDNLSGGSYQVQITDLSGCDTTLNIHLISFGSLTDSRDSQEYQTVVIGEQVWMAENLNYGVHISSEVFASDNGIVEKYALNDEDSTLNWYGGLYTWDEAMEYTTTEGTQGICPDGWHIPSNSDWEELEAYLGMSQSEIDIIDATRGTDQGDRLKIAEQCYGGENCNNTGFSAICAGLYFSEEIHFEYFDAGSFHSSNEFNEEQAIERVVFLGESGLGKYGMGKKSMGRSVRCIKDN